jgi:hypothetical protein
MSLSDPEVDRLSPSTNPPIHAPSPAPKPASRGKEIKVKRGVLLSDDETEEFAKKNVKRSKKGKGRAILGSDDEDVDQSLGGMMDLDDSSFIFMLERNFH